MNLFLKLKTVFFRNFWLISALFFILLRVPSLYEPNWYGDEGIYLVLGQAIRKGLLLYRDIHDNKPPLLYYAAALSQNVFGFRLLLSLLMIPTIYFFYRLIKQLVQNENIVKLSTFLFLIITSVPTFEGNIANAEVFMLLPTILGVYLVLKPRSGFDFLTAGLLLGIALIIKIPVFIEITFLIFWLISSSLDLLPKINFSPQKFIQSLHYSSLLILGFVTPIIILGIYYYLRGAFPEYLNASLLQNFSYLSSWTTGTHSGSATQGGVLIRGILLLIAWLVLFFLNRYRLIENKLYFTSLWFAATLFGSTLSTRPYPHYLIQILPPLVILFAFFLTSPIKQKLLPVFFFLFTLFIFKKYDFYSYPVIKYYQNFYSFIFKQKDQTSYNQSFSPGVNQDLEIANYLKDKVTPGDRIFVWGDHPFIYVLTDTLPTGRFTVAYHVVDFKGYFETLDSLKIYTPSYILYYPMANRPFPELDDFIRRYYFLDHQFGQINLYRLR